MSDLVVRHERNPDMFHEGCQVTGRAEPGVSFPSVEPADGTYMFIGETALIEAVATFFGITPDEAHKRLTEEMPVKQENTNQKTRIKKLEADLERWDRWRKEAEVHGMVINAFEV